MQVRINYLFITAIILLVCSFVPSGHAQRAFEVDKVGIGSPVILIPGLISGGEVWDQTVDALKQDHECHVLTLAGFAGVDPLKNGPYLRSFRNAIIDYIEKHELENVSLIGHSMGGFLALWIGLDNLPEVRQLIIVDAMPFLPAAFNPNATERFDSTQAFAYMQSLEKQSSSELKSVRQMVARNMSRDSASWNKMVEWAMASDLRTEAFSLYEMMAMDLRDDISQIKVPVVVFVPYQDNPMAPQMNKDTVYQLYADQYSSLEEGTIEVIEDSGHFIMLDRYNEFIDVLKAYLNLQ